jgi:peptidoglycan DL-endopeptidase CwlO
VTDEERLFGHSTPKSGRRLRVLRTAAPSLLTLVIVCSYTVLPSARPAAAATSVTDLKAKASQIESEISSTGQKIDALDQQYEGAVTEKAAVDQQITTTQGQISQTQKTVTGDQKVLRKAAVEAYMTNASANAQNPLFEGNQEKADDSSVYTSVAEGDVSSAVASLHTAENQLNVQESSLKAQDAKAQAAATAAQQAQQQAQGEEAQQQAALNQVNTQITALIKQQQAAAEAAAAAAASAKLASQRQAATQAAQTAKAAAPSGVSGVTDPPPPPSSGGAGTRAVAAAESQIGVPYVWGGESPGVGFDCSGLTAWAWGQAGVSLPHFSGAQMSDSTPVPLSDLQPGDLLFYGAGGSQHVAMYVGGGSMIEAPYTGASVWITALRTGTGDFAGAGRP